MVTGPGTLICQVSDMDRGVAFYRDVLGLTPGVVSAWWSDFQIGGLRIGLHPPYRAESPKGGGWSLGVEVSDLAALRRRLDEAGYPTPHAYHDVPGGAVLDFADPDGNPLQAIQLGAKASDLA